MRSAEEKIEAFRTVLMTAMAIYFAFVGNWFVVRLASRDRTMLHTTR